MQVQITSYKCDLQNCPNVTDGKGLDGYVQLTQFAFYYHNRGNEVRQGGEKTLLLQRPLYAMDRPAGRIKGAIVVHTIQRPSGGLRV